jgi:hypothetical protein
MGSFVYKKFIHYCVVYAFGINYGAALRETLPCRVKRAPPGAAAPCGPVAVSAGTLGLAAPCSDRASPSTGGGS